MLLFDEYLKVLKSLNNNDVEYILVGGLAVIFHGMPRFTEDIDIFILVENENVEKLNKSFKAIFNNDPAIDEITLNELNNYPVIRYGIPSGEFYIDVMTSIGTSFNYNDLEFEVINIKGVDVRIATAETLLKMKINTVRDKDKPDVYFLKELIRQNENTEKS